MPAYNREAICQFCNTKIIPPKKGFRSSANGNYICEDCVKLLGQALDVRGSPILRLHLLHQVVVCMLKRHQKRLKILWI